MNRTPVILALAIMVSSTAIAQPNIPEVTVVRKRAEENTSNQNGWEDGKQYASANEYDNQVNVLATSVPEATEEQAAEWEWLPLGVFAITAEGVNASSMYLQLAVTKTGVIGGTFYNESTGVTHPIEGMVDEETQRAAWKAVDGSNADVVMETGLFNLTQDQAPVLVHFGPEEPQTALLVRLDESERPGSSE